LVLLEAAHAPTHAPTHVWRDARGTLGRGPAAQKVDSKLGPDTPIDEQVEAIFYGADFGDELLRKAMESELRERMIAARREGRPLRVYCGYDPTRPDLHIGHSITMRRLRVFQDMGHHVIFLVGTFTAQVGDASDQLSGRPRRTSEEVATAARTYAEQCYRILDRERTEIAYNGDWLTNLPLADFVAAASHFTVQQFMARDAFRKRLEAQSPIAVHELFYALLQGYDAVHLRADVQIGATEQLFNIQAGRKLQQAMGQPPCICITYPILVGTDGQMRMAKSTGNTVGIADPPDDQYGKVMSVSDETLFRWLPYVTRWSPAEIERRVAAVRSGGESPMELKKALACEIVSQLHGDDAAAAAQAHFETVHQRGEIPDDVPECVLSEPRRILDILADVDGVGSRREARRLLAERGVKLDGEVVVALDHTVERDALLQVGKRRFLRLVFRRVG
jgi:tyrosyl-tRNA synthetase